MLDSCGLLRLRHGTRSLCLSFFGTRIWLRVLVNHMADFHVDIGGQQGIKPKFLILAGGVAWAFYLNEFA